MSSPPVLLYSGACSLEIHRDEPKLLSAALGTLLVMKTWYLMQRRGLCGVTIPNTSYIPVHLMACNYYGEDGTSPDSSAASLSPHHALPITVEYGKQTLPSTTWTHHFPNGDTPFQPIMSLDWLT
ncbi:uncharacterized protein ARMOST_18141 [Armillaria ostoyae]|uniref:Uncharacterized protein n=1 Tax=Armillaria ostoyae TaxID=47428 RepID=A0A284S147_ARMOS|nr:uncharacterized protein ARMOST_18141 [Armillaria ostoyae]